MKNSDKSIVILSGGMDSVTTLAYASNKGFKNYCITFNYWQKSYSEINAAKYYANYYNCLDHKIFEINFDLFTESSLISENINVPSENFTDKIPNTYVPLRNIIFLSIACSWAESLSIKNIFLGVNSIDYSGYPDCRPEFIQKFTDMLSVGTKSGSQNNNFNIHTPLIELSKIDIIRLGKSLNVDYYNSVSCYQANEKVVACGKCESCLFRKNAFKEFGIQDETKYF